MSASAERVDCLRRRTEPHEHETSRRCSVREQLRAVEHSRVGTECGCHWTRNDLLVLLEVGECSEGEAPVRDLECDERSGLSGLTVVRLGERDAPVPKNGYLRAQLVRNSQVANTKELLTEEILAAGGRAKPVDEL